MFNWFKKKKIFRNMQIKGIFVLIIIFSSLFLVSFIKEIYRNYKVNKEIEILKEQITLLSSENEELTSLIDYLKTDNFIEKEARIKFGMKKNGEKEVIIDNKSIYKDQDNLESYESDGNKEISNFKKWRMYFFEEICF